MKRIVKDIEKLRVPAEPLEFLTEAGVSREEGDEIVKAIKEVMEKHTDIIALAAPQIGINKRIFCIRFNDVIKTFINPIVTKKSGNVIAPETCTSMPGKEILIARPAEVTVVYYTDAYKYEDNKLLGPAARIFDQMTQLLDGIAPDVLGLVSDVEQDGSLADLSEEEINELAELYKTFIAAKTKAAKEALESADDAALQNEYKQLKVAEDIINGRTLLINDGPKMNREQRRAAAKQAKRIKAKKAGK